MAYPGNVNDSDEFQLSSELFPAFSKAVRTAETDRPARGERTRERPRSGRMTGDSDAVLREDIRREGIRPDNTQPRPEGAVNGNIPAYGGGEMLPTRRESVLRVERPRSERAENEAERLLSSKGERIQEQSEEPVKERVPALFGDISLEKVRSLEAPPEETGREPTLLEFLSQPVDGYNGPVVPLVPR